MVTGSPKSKSPSAGKAKKANRKRPVDDLGEEPISSPPLKKGSAVVTPCSVNEAFKTIKNDSGELFLDPESMTSYVEDDVWAILEECGFRYNTSGFGHPDIDKKDHSLVQEDFGHEEGLRKYLCRHGIVNLNELEDKEDVEVLTKWVVFANVPLKESEFKGALEKLPLPSDDDALEWLKKLGFQVEEGTGNIFRITADGMEYFHSLEEARCFVRSADDTVLLATPEDSKSHTPRKRSRRSRAPDFPLTDEKLLALRLWAAVSPAPLPKIGGDDSDDEQEIPADSRVGPNTCVIL